jgi:hypothetical protein
MNETQQIEWATAEGFLRLFNQRFGVNYEIVELGDAPDVRCQDSDGRARNLEITLTEDRPGDIQAALGRSDHRNLENFSLSYGSSLRDDVLEQVAKRIKIKAYKRYGADTALVVRDTSGVGWNCHLVTDELETKIDSMQHSFDKGTWVLSRSKTELYQIA